MNSQKRLRYHQYSSYCPDDKDVYDYLKARTPPSEKLLHFLKGRGIIARKPGYSEKDALIEYISTLPIDWESLNALTDLVEVRDHGDNVTSEKVVFPRELSEVREAMKEIEDLRHLRDNEAYRLVGHSPTSLSYEVDYIDTENKFSRLMQRRPRTLQITVEKVNDDLIFRYSNVERGLVIFEGIKGVLAEHINEDDKKPLQSSNVSFEGILDPVLRIRFFELFTRQIQGLEFVTVSNIRFDRLPKEMRQKIDDEELTDQDDESEIYTEEEEKIKRVIFKGKDLTTTPEFKKFAAQGFFIASQSWTVEDTTTREQIHLQAAFQIPDTGLGFEYKIRGKTIVDADGKRTHEKVAPTTAEEYYRRIESAAEKALDVIRKEASK